jgi:uncharacterized protein with HEPN domain
MPTKFSHSDGHFQDAYLHDMLESARHVWRYMEGVTFEDFLADSEKRDAVSMRLSVIGDAARNITKETEVRLPAIPFKDIRGMRNRITHDYGHVDFRIVWEVTKEHIAPLIAALEQHFLPKENSRSAAPEPPSTKRPPVN